MTKVLDEDTRLKLLGLKVLAMDLGKQLKTIEASVARLVGETGEAGWAGDYCWDEGITPEHLWERTAESRGH